jgi:hypothetical protein
MPIINYANSIIYLILDKLTRECYVGSTATSLAKRMYRHRQALQLYNKWVAGGQEGRKRGHCASFTILQRNQYVNFELERYPCNDKRELRSREGHYIDKYRQDVGALCLNKRREGINGNRDRKQYRIDNKEKIDAYNKAYNSRPYTCPDCDKTIKLGSKSSHLQICKVRKARLQTEQATTTDPPQATPIVPFTNKQPVFVNTKHSVKSSVGIVFA